MTNPAAGMPCPVCKVPLVMSDRQGVEIDYCPQCRGVWLDRGELDKIIERSAQDLAAAASPQQQQAAPQAPPPQAPQRGYEQRGYEQRPYYGDDDGRHQRHPHGKRRKSFFEELFD